MIFILASWARVYTTRDFLPKGCRGLGTEPQQVPSAKKPFFGFCGTRANLALTVLHPGQKRKAPRTHRAPHRARRRSAPDKIPAQTIKGRYRAKWAGCATVKYLFTRSGRERVNGYTRINRRMFNSKYQIIPFKVLYQKLLIFKLF